MGCKLAISALENYRLTSNTRVDVENRRIFRLSLRRVIISLLLILSSRTFRRGFDLFSCFNYIEIIWFLLISAEILNFWRQASHIVKLELPATLLT